MCEGEELSLHLKMFNNFELSYGFFLLCLKLCCLWARTGHLKRGRKREEMENSSGREMKINEKCMSQRLCSPKISSAVVVGTYHDAETAAKSGKNVSIKCRWGFSAVVGFRVLDDDVDGDEGRERVGI